MKTTLAVLFLLLTFNAVANSNIVITGVDAEKMFIELKDAYQYSTGAKTSSIEYKLTVRHNESVSCEKEETRYSPDEAFEVVYSCEIKN